MSRWQRPEPNARGFRLCFHGQQCRISVVLTIDPRGAASDHLSVYVHAIGKYDADSAPVPVCILDLHYYRFGENQLAKLLPSPGAIRLVLFWRIDIAQAHLVLLLARIKARQGIPIAESYYFASERLPHNPLRKKQKPKTKPLFHTLRIPHYMAIGRGDKSRICYRDLRERNEG